MGEMFTQTDKFEKDFRAFEQSILAAKSFSALYEILEQAKVIEGSEKTYQARDIITLIESVRQSFRK